LEAFNVTQRKKMPLVIFTYVLEHVARISRVINLPFGHCLCIGVGGSGRQSCTRLAAHIAEFKPFQGQVAKDYSRTDWLNDIRDFLLYCGQQGEPGVFLVNDSQIVEEEFLEDICNILNTGEVPNIMAEQEEEIGDKIRAAAKEAGYETHTKTALMKYFVDRCRALCHVVLAFSPVGDTLRHRLRQFPSLVNCTTIDWFTPWPAEGLRSVATSFLEDVQASDQEKEAAVECCVAIHRDSQKMAAVYAKETRMNTYVTPTSYLELINTYKKLFHGKKLEISQAKYRYDAGLRTLDSTEKDVSDKESELELLRPTLERTMAETREAEKDISKQKEAASEKKEVVAKDEAETAIKEAEARKIQTQCEDELQRALPRLEEALQAVRNIKKDQLTLIKSFTTPPGGAKIIMSGVCVLLGETVKPKKGPDGKPQDIFDAYWDVCKKKVMSDVGKFQQVLLTFSDEMDGIKDIEKRLATLRSQYFTLPIFNDMSKAKQIAEALPGIVSWMKAAEYYYVVNQKVKPMKETLSIARADLARAEADLKQKRDELKQVDDKLNLLQEGFEKMKRKGEELQDKFTDTTAKLDRAMKLIKGLSSEKGRYQEQSTRLGEVFENIPGDVILSSGQIAYLGPYTSKYRATLLAGWVKMCKDKKIPGTDPFSLESFLGDALEVQRWKMASLPADPFSVDNAVMVKNSSRWPLFIDPQLQANNWIKNMEGPELQVICPEQDPKNYMTHLKRSIENGWPVLMENVGETLDPSLEPLLLKQKFKEGGSWYILLGAEETVEYNDKFKLYITTKLPRPHYKPEVSTKVSCIAFMITLQGLTDQLLGKVVSFEEKELDDRKKKAVADSARFKARLKELEDDILKKLTDAESTEALLSNEDIIVTLDISGKTSEEIKDKMQDINLVKQRFDKVQHTFMLTAAPASALFFCIDQLANINSMYQYSLQFYLDLFQKSLELSKPKIDDPVPLDGGGTKEKPRYLEINEYFIYSLYKNVCLSLFAKDKLLFSFRMSVALGECDVGELRFVLTGGIDEKPTKAGPDWLPEQNWELLWRAQQQLPAFKNFANKFLEDEKAWQTLFLSKTPDLIMKRDPEGTTPLLPETCIQLTDMQKLVLLRCLRSDKLVPAVTQFIINDEKLGEEFTDPPIFDLEQCYRDTPEPWVPMIFVLSRGADPGNDLQLLAEKEGKSQMFTKLSLGQGQKDVAEAAIQKARKDGSWVLLQNCHLYADWMPEMQRIIEQYSNENRRDDPKFLNPGFRLWLTAMPAECFPREVLQNGMKMVLEPPKGLRSNILRSYSSDPINHPQFFNGCNKDLVWKKLLFGLCFFHSSIQERRAFGPLGWNIPYEFNDTDLRISIRQLQMFLNEGQEVPLPALLYLISECNYGGRVTDDRDRRCLKNILDNFFCEELYTEESYRFSPSGVYVAPPDGEWQSYVDFIRDLPSSQPPEIFGLHPNADITREEFETTLLLDACLLTLPRDSGGDDEDDKADPKAIVGRLARDIKESMGAPFDVGAVAAKYPTNYHQSMNTVLFQECVRFNRLISLVHSTLGELQKAIRGEVVMSAELDGVFNAMFDSKVPALWMKKSYPSLKPLGAYVEDLRRRIKMLSDWYEHGPPPIFWLPGFYFPQAFLTGVQQNYARAQHLEIDKLDWQFEVIDVDPAAEGNQAPEWGCSLYGLFMEGAGFDREKKVMCESRPKEIFQEFPVMYLKPCLSTDCEWKDDEDGVYMCPVYRTTDRRGVLMTTGHSTNYIMPWYLKINKLASPPEPPSHWVKRGTALFCSLPR